MRHRVLTGLTLVAGLIAAAPPAAAAPDVPSPTAVVASAGDGSATVAWQPSAGASGYVVSALPGGGSCTTTVSSCEVTGLVNGVTYRFGVVATSDAGLSPVGGPSDPVRPLAPPVVSGTVLEPQAGVSGLFAWAPGDGDLLLAVAVIGLLACSLLVGASVARPRGRATDLGLDEVLAWSEPDPTPAPAPRPARARPATPARTAGRTAPARRSAAARPSGTRPRSTASRARA